MTKPAPRRASMQSRTISNEAMTRRFVVCTLLLIAADPCQAGDANDLLAGRSKDCPSCVLPHAKLKRFDLGDADLVGADLTAANLHRARLPHAKLRGANLTGANLNKTDLKRADLAGARLGEAMLYE